MNSFVYFQAITIDFASLHRILKSGSLLYRTYLQRKKEKERNDHEAIPECLERTKNPEMYLDAVRNLEILELLEYNSTLRKLSAVQKRHLESLAEGPKYFAPGERLWRSGAHVENAFVIVGGTVSFAAKRRNAGSAAAFDMVSVSINSFIYVQIALIISVSNIDSALKSDS